MFGFFKKKVAQVIGDEFDLQAIEDQKKADYPECVQGLMHCRAFCGSECPRPLGFVRARARTLRKRATCQHTRVGPKFSTLFESLGPRGEICLDCDLVRDEPGQPWRERDD